MARYAGTDLYVAWIYTGGTVDLSADYRSLSTNEEVNDIDASAGDDTYVDHLPALADASAELEFLDTTGATGSTQWVAIAPRTEGTLQWDPEGTASGYSWSAAAYVQTRSREIPYDDVVSVSATFQLTAEPSMSAN